MCRGNPRRPLNLNAENDVELAETTQTHSQSNYVDVKYESFKQLIVGYVHKFVFHISICIVFVTIPFQ